MKRGLFIMAALCVATPAIADDTTTNDPHRLVVKANELRDAGKLKEALAYYCSYMFTAPAGDDADYASQQAHLLKPGAVTDHDACTAQPTVAPVRTIVLYDVLPEPPPRISKREIAGLATIGLALASFGTGLYESSRVSHYHSLIAAIDPMNPGSANIDSLQSKADTAETAEKWLLASGAAAAVLGGVLYLTGRHDRIEATAVTIAPTANRHGAGLALSGGF